MVQLAAAYPPPRLSPGGWAIAWRIAGAEKSHPSCIWHGNVVESAFLLSGVVQMLPPFRTPGAYDEREPSLNRPFWTRIDAHLEEGGREAVSC